jgi:hypothetical protein
MTDTPSGRPTEPTAPEPTAPRSTVADSGTTIETDENGTSGRPVLPEQATTRGRAAQGTPQPSWQSPSPTLPPAPSPRGPGTAHGAPMAPVNGWEWSGAWFPRPGVIALRPLAFSDLLGASLAVFRRHWRVVVLFSGCIALIAQAATSTTSGLGISATATFTLPSTSDGNTPQLLHQEVHLLRSLLPVLGVTVPVAVFTAVLGGALLAPIVSRAVLGRSSALAEVWPEIRSQLLRSLGLAAAATVGLSAITAVFVAPAVVADLSGAPDSAVLSLALLAIPGGLLALWLYISINLSGPALVLERQSLRAAVSRSLRLVKGAWWRVFGLTLLVSILVDITTGLLASPTVIVDMALNSGDRASTADLILTGVVGVLISTLTIPITSAFCVLLYVDQRIRREALDLELAAAAGVPQYGY